MPSTNVLSDDLLIGMFYQAQQEVPQTWADRLAFTISTDSEVTEVGFLEQVDAPTERKGAQEYNDLLGDKLMIQSRHFTSGLRIKAEDMRRAKSDQIQVRIADLARRFRWHRASLLTDLITENGDAYTGSKFFSKAANGHVWGENQTKQGNEIDVDISALPVQNAATVGTNERPTGPQFQHAFSEATAAMLGFLDNASEPINEGASAFTLLVPPNLLGAASTLRAPQISENQVSVAQMGSVMYNGLSVDIQVNARLTGKSSFYLFINGPGLGRPFLIVEETPVMMIMNSEGSDSYIDQRVRKFVAEQYLNAGYGFWNLGCKVNLT